MKRECPICGESIRAFRGCFVTKGIAPPEYQTKWNEDVRACDNPHSKNELIDISIVNGILRLFNGKSFEHPNISKAKDEYNFGTSTV